MKEIDSQFGGCPECGGQDGFLYSGRENWFICDTHLTKWLVGAGLFSSWQHMTDEELIEQRDRLSEYREVKPIYPRDETIDDLRARGLRLPEDALCPRCGASMQATHHPFCEARNGTPTQLADKTVRFLLGIPDPGGSTGDLQP